MRSKLHLGALRAFALGAALAFLSFPSLAFARTYHVVIENMKFTPATVDVKPGDTIVWENHDIVPHTVSSKAHFGSGSIASDGNFSYRVKRKGKIEYACQFHPMMKVEIRVK